MIFETSCCPVTTRSKGGSVTTAGPTAYEALQKAIDSGYSLFCLTRPQSFTYGTILTIHEKIELRKAKKQGKQPKLVDQWRHGMRVITKWELV